ncbi:Phosphotransferase enzyme family [Aspergillus sclerotialis]|uniref:Phosphotransferase enzyme family n=1 Tax=Aspergillus sclerotialis TaxID=2070753 RepID=A0A3A2ZPH2_9EURO|nr:Phosphotransferase enzyme family [Aspergillus sclerotialis]
MVDNFPVLNWKNDEYYSQHPSRKQVRDACLQRVDWTALCEYASSLNAGKPCRFLDQSTIGGVHLIRILSFGDTQWIARVQLEPSTPTTESLLRAEIDTKELIRARTDIPVPKVYGYKLHDANSIRAAFILMEFLPGSSAMDADGGYEVHHGSILPERRSFFYKQVASIQVQLASIRLPKIGTVIKRDNNSVDIGPIPGLGRPFSTATEFFKAWAKHAKFPLSDRDIREFTKNGPTEEILSSIHNFPRRLRKLASRISINDIGPFPLYHPDFYHSNIIVDGSFRVLGVIDWEGACTIPWDLVEPPLFLGIVPPAMDDPRNYKENGQPWDEDSIQRLN